MNKELKTPINPIVAEKEGWHGVVTHFGFQYVRTYIDNRIRSIDAKIESLSENTTLDSALQVSGLHKAKKELKQFLLVAEQYAREFVVNKGE